METCNFRNLKNYLLLKKIRIKILELKIRKILKTRKRRFEKSRTGRLQALKIYKKIPNLKMKVTFTIMNITSKRSISRS